MRTVRITESEAKRICRDYQQGWPLRSICLKFNRNETSVRRCLKLNGVNMRPIGSKCAKATRQTSVQVILSAIQEVVYKPCGIRKAISENLVRKRLNDAYPCEVFQSSALEAAFRQVHTLPNIQVIEGLSGRSFRVVQ